MFNKWVRDMILNFDIQHNSYHIWSFLFNKIPERPQVEEWIDNILEIGGINNTDSKFNELPNEVLYKIVSFIEKDSLPRFRATSKQMNNIVRDFLLVKYQASVEKRSTFFNPHIVQTITILTDYFKKFGYEGATYLLLLKFYPVLNYEPEKYAFHHIVAIWIQLLAGVKLSETNPKLHPMQVFLLGNLTALRLFRTYARRCYDQVGHNIWSCKMRTNRFPIVLLKNFQINNKPEPDSLNLESFDLVETSYDFFKKRTMHLSFTIIATNAHVALFHRLFENKFNPNMIPDVLPSDEFVMQYDLNSYGFR
ncbi:uncharacterized protein LOC119682819 [Teleopsis dalmanni]|uniref:uncharacterized protein LOC119682819 n=1 Tax=Teleopsis dalmanni TaxID=139649 RepID=UPI0018CEC283|nr:uncharacterized protein LOC119682819 [Teleopsis dalmanni]